MANAILEEIYNQHAPYLSYWQKEWYDKKMKDQVKTEGWVYYRFKRETKYPARVYVFIDAEFWRDRNLRPMGLSGSHDFLRRKMTKHELAKSHFYQRLKYYQYENWEKLLRDEEMNANELEIEHPGEGIKFLLKLKEFSTKFKIGERPKALEYT